ncbi:class C sortase [Thomasclavelia sp.]
MMRKFLIVLTVIGFLIGLGIFLYPHISSWLIDNEVKDAIKEFEENGSLVQSKQENELYQAMIAYNEALYKSGQSEISDAWTFKQEEFKLNGYDYKNNAVATITIPKMELEMPIYLGATKENMSRGIVNLGNTSLPIGGKNTNCVLAGHRGYRGAPFFRNIEDLQAGDEIIISNYWEQLKYNVFEIKVIYPTESEQILIQDGKDMVTLITCHPYRNNYQRYVVYCRRSDEFDSSTVIPDHNNDDIVSSKADIASEQRLPFIMLGIFGIGVISVFIYIRLNKKHRRK